MVVGLAGTGIKSARHVNVTGCQPGWPATGGRWATVALVRRSAQVLEDLGVSVALKLALAGPLHR